MNVIYTLHSSLPSMCQDPVFNFLYISNQSKVSSPSFTSSSFQSLMSHIQPIILTDDQAFTREDTEFYCFSPENWRHSVSSQELSHRDPQTDARPLFWWGGILENSPSISMATFKSLGASVSRYGGGGAKRDTELSWRAGHKGIA